MMSLEDAVRRIIQDNQSAREEAAGRLSRLINATAEGDYDEFRRTIGEILEVGDGEARGGDGEDQASPGSNGSAAFGGDSGSTEAQSGG